MSTEECQGSKCGRPSSMTCWLMPRAGQNKEWLGLGDGTGEVDSVGG